MEQVGETVILKDVCLFLLGLAYVVHLFQGRV